MIQLTPNFKAHEFVVSSEHPALAAQIMLSDEDIQKYHWLCLFGLEPIRRHFLSSVKILSGKRSPRLNRAVGGSTHSQHLFAEAADFCVIGIDSLAVYMFAHKQLLWPGQLGVYVNKKMLHIALPKRGIAPNHWMK